ncbi:DUF5658 family protein [Methanolacinia petrolearia]|uniref:DUF5658 family protein n=1 Tax=Methanolacinia petrolearia TaxID=54120 RepID=UPI003BAB3C66
MGGSELNPLMIDIVSHPWLHSIVKFIAALFVIAVACYTERLKKNAGATILVIACSIFLLVVAHNVCVLIGFPRLVFFRAFNSLGGLPLFSLLQTGRRGLLRHSSESPLRRLRLRSAG